jgi:hypothetical protein
MSKSKMNQYRDKIEMYLEKGASVRSVWFIIMADLKESQKVTYETFFRYVRKYIQIKR